MATGIPDPRAISPLGGMTSRENVLPRRAAWNAAFTDGSDRKWLFLRFHTFLQQYDACLLERCLTKNIVFVHTRNYEKLRSYPKEIQWSEELFLL